MTEPRTTRQKEAIYRIVKNLRTHPTAEEVFMLAKKSVQNISFATVYRNLKVLKEEGKIFEVNFGEPFGRFEGTLAQHSEFVCNKCGKIFDVNEPLNKSHYKKLSGRTGFRILSHRVLFHGLCKNCK